MTVDNFTVQVLVPAEGHFLTQAADVADKDRVVSERVFLAPSDSPENWREISSVEANAITTRQRIAAQSAAAQSADD